MAALIGTSNCFCSGLAVEPDEVETVWHDDQLMWSQRQSEWELGPLLLPLEDKPLLSGEQKTSTASILSSETFTEFMVPTTGL